MKRLFELVLVVFLLLPFTFIAQEKEREKSDAVKNPGKELQNSITLIAQEKEREKFDSLKDPAKDLQHVIKLAKKENKRIMLDVGGEWCIWCHRLDEFILADNEIDSTLHANFIVVKINFSKENKNESFLSKYPKVEGYPHIFILEKDGKLLYSKNTGELEAEKSYSKEKLLNFYNEWKIK